jgi:hypothetical protein
MVGGFGPPLLLARYCSRSPLHIVRRFAAADRR